MVTEQLGNLFRVRSGDGISIANLSAFGIYPVYGGNGVNGYTSNYNVENETMVIGRVGEKCGNVKITQSRGWVSDNALIVTPKVKYDIEYMRYLLEQINLNDYANRNAQPVISGQIIYALETPYVGDVDEQGLIAQNLRCFDTYIDDLTELIEKKRGIRDGALDDLTAGRTRMEGFCGERKEYTISDITRTVITGGTPSTARQEYYGGNIPWLSSTEIHQKRIKKPTTYITDLGLQNSSAKIAPERSVLIALAGQGKTRGTAAYLTRPMALNQSLAALVTNEKCNPEFLYYLIESMYLSLRELSSGDGGRGGLNKKLIKGVTVTIPVDVAEQEAIADTLTAMDEEIEELEIERDKIIQIREGAMDDLLTGRVRLSV